MNKDKTTTKTAVILAAGIGKRLDIFETPKPLVKLRAKPLIIWAIETLEQAGINKIYIIIKKGDKLIKKELIDYPGDIEFIEQVPDKKDMLGSILSIGERINGPFFVMACDMIFDHNPLVLFDKYDKKDTIMVLVSTNHKYNAVSGAQERILYQDQKIYYTEHEERHIAMEAGVYHFTNESYKDFVKIAEKNKDITRVSHVFDQYNRKKGLTPVVMEDNEWFDINEPVTLVRAELFLRKKLSPGKKLKVKSIKYKKLKTTAAYDYKKRLRFDVNVKRGIVKRINEYEIIPHEHYYSPHHIVVDKNIDQLYGDKIYKQFKSLGYRINKILVDPGERSKSLESYARIADEMVVSGIDKKSIIISVGGGVIKDLAGFLASTIYRGIGLISFPTTVLSQCDAAIALKQGINGDKGKNLLGSFYVPMKVIVDPATLLTLEEHYIYDGLAECLKQSFAQDKKFFDFFSGYQGKIKDLNFLEKVVTKAIKLKLTSIEQDYHEENVALVNQYGHEIGHAIEHLSGYKLLHGESVAVGMRVSAELSYIMGIAKKEVVDTHIELLQKYNLPINIPRDIKPEDILSSLRFSKKYHGNQARFVLINKIGSMWHDGDYYFVTCSDEIIKEAISRSYII